MKKLSEHLETVRAKPPHVRKRVAFATAFGVTAVIAILWFGISLATGAYAIQGTSFAQATAEASPVAVVPAKSSGGLLSAVESAFDTSSPPAHLEVTSSGSAAPIEPSGPRLPSDPGGPTVIPF